MNALIRLARRVTPAVALAAALGMSGCSSSDNGSSVQPAMHMNPKTSSLEATLDTLLQAHVDLASDATREALVGNQDGFNAAAGALDQNSQDIANAIGSVYGADAGAKFLPLWRRHIGYVVDYTKALAGNDKDGQDKAVNNLVQYTQDFGQFIENATGGRLKQDAVAGLVKDHILGLKSVVDAQAKKDYQDEYSKLRDSEEHMSMIGNTLAGAIHDQFPDKF